MNHTAQELFEILNEQDECPWIEAKGGGDSSHSVMETVCSYANEPGLGGGYILMGMALDSTVLFPHYKIKGVADPDKFQRDFSTQCSGMFNIPIRPEVTVEKIYELKSYNLFAAKGKGKATYYIPGPGLNTEAPGALSTEPTVVLSTQAPKISTPPHDLNEKYDVADIEIDKKLSTPPLNLSTPPPDLSAPPPDLSAPPPSILIDESLQKEIDILNRREHDSNKIKGIIKEICKDRYLSARQISGILNKGEDYIKRKYLSEMIKSRDLIYLYAEMINHPEQAYKTNED